jgi:hypothetical protein
MALTSPPTAADPRQAETASSLFAEMRRAHERLFDAIADLERIAGGDAPDRNQFTDIRWRLSKASLNRRLLWAKILGYLLPLAGERTTATLHQLQDADIDLLRASTEHVSNWTTERALALWPHYCEASRIMRGKMISGIEAEKRLLYPILEAVSRGEVAE